MHRCVQNDSEMHKTVSSNTSRVLTEFYVVILYVVLQGHNKLN